MHKQHCWACTHSHDPDIRGFHGAAPGLDRRVEELSELLVKDLADNLDTPDPTNAELASLLRKRLEPALVKMMARAQATGDPKSVLAALNALKQFEGEGAAEKMDWLLDSPAGATDSE